MHAKMPKLFFDYNFAGVRRMWSDVVKCSVAIPGRICLLCLALQILLFVMFSVKLQDKLNSVGCMPRCRRRIYSISGCAICSPAPFSNSGRRKPEA